MRAHDSSGFRVIRTAVRAGFAAGQGGIQACQPERDQNAVEGIPRSACGATWGSGGNPEKRQRRDAGQPERDQNAVEGIPRSACGATWGSGGNPEKRQRRDAGQPLAAIYPVACRSSPCIRTGGHELLCTTDGLYPCIRGAAFAVHQLLRPFR